MKTLLNMPGIITVLNTPFSADDGIDIASLRLNVRRALDAGVAGFLVPAMASEVGKLTESERDAMLTAVLEETCGGVPVIGGASAATQAERLRYARRCVELGCPGVLVSLTYADDAQYERELREVAAVGPSFLMIQDWDFAGYGAPVPLIARLFEEVEVFRCLKVEVVPAGRKYSEVLAATGGRLHVSGGWAVMQIIEALDRGVHAFMPTGMHSIYTRIFSQYHEGDRDGAAELFQRLLPVLAFSNQHLDISIHFFKRLLHAEGVYSTPRVREPILSFDRYHERVAGEMIERVKAITASVEKTNKHSSLGHKPIPDPK
jgi:4-hydroxy-tetrahydrodipicolinate synthase